MKMFHTDNEYQYKSLSGVSMKYIYQYSTSFLLFKIVQVSSNLMADETILSVCKEHKLLGLMRYLSWQRQV